MKAGTRALGRLALPFALLSWYSSSVDYYYNEDMSVAGAVSGGAFVTVAGVAGAQGGATLGAFVGTAIAPASGSFAVALPLVGTIGGALAGAYFAGEGGESVVGFVLRPAVEWAWRRQDS